MRRLLLLSVAALGITLAATQAHAQSSAAQSQFPPATNGQNTDMGMSPNSLPRGGVTGTTGAAGGAINAAPTAPPPTAAYSPDSGSGVNTLHPLRQPRHRAARRSRRHVTHPAPASSSDASPLRATTAAG